MENNYDAVILGCMNNYKRHEITVICDHERVKRFQFRQPDTGCYGFNLTTADNLIVVNGDIGTLVLEPGYGRDGFIFLRSNILRDWGYLLGKCPFKDEISQYSYEEAMENLEYYVEQEYINKEDIKYINNLDGGDYWGHVAYYEFCHEHNIDEPISPKRLTNSTLNQIAGLQCFIKKYEELFGSKESAQ